MYKINEKIGSGAYGEVYKGVREDDGLQVALKRVILTDEDNHNNIPLSTHRELNALKQLSKQNNNNIVRIFDIVLNKVESKMCIDIVFELSEYDLELYLKQFNLGGDMHISKIINLGQQLMDGVHFMHVNRIIHRDLKPANILIDRSGTDLKITDFGLARVLGFDAPFTPVAVTLWYRSPEILLKNSYSTGCDVWSAGCIIGEMVCGRPLFKEDNEVKQLEKIVCRLGYEAINHWPQDSFIDVRSFINVIDPARSIDQLLRRADVNLRSLIKSMLRFDQNFRMLSNEALTRLNELHKPLTTINKTVEDQNYNVVGSVLRNVLDDGDDTYDDDFEIDVPETTDEDCKVSQSVTSHESDGDDHTSVISQPEDHAEVGDSFGSYRSQNNESFSSYAQSSHTGTESPDEDPADTRELHDDLSNFHDGFIISDDSDSDTREPCRSESTTTTARDENDLLLVTELEETSCQQKPPSPEETLCQQKPPSPEETSCQQKPPSPEETSCQQEPPSPKGKSYNEDGPSLKDSPLTKNAYRNISPFLVPVDTSDNDSQGYKLIRQKSSPLQERNTVTEDQVTPLKTETATRKRIIRLDNSDDSADEAENASPCQPRPGIVRHNSQRRRLSLAGPPLASNRRPPARASSIFVPPPICEEETLANTSFGERSLSRALLPIEDGLSPVRMSGRPRVIVRRRSHFK